MVGIGPGLGTNKATKQAIHQLFKLKNDIRIVVDADALNCIAEGEQLLQSLPKNTVLTPHPKEFERIAGKTSNHYQRLKVQKQFSQDHQCIVVLKDAITSVSFPDGKVYFNTTGNAALATGGSGDVLTGIITGLLAQSYTPEEAALFGVYIHGLSAELASNTIDKEAVIAGDIISYLKYSFTSL